MAISGRVTVITVGTPVRLSDVSTPFSTLNVYALPLNTTAVHVGNKWVSAQAGHESGDRIDLEAIAHYRDGDLMDIYVDALTADEGVHFGGF